MGEASEGEPERKRTIGNYELGRVLGAGAFCKVRFPASCPHLCKKALLDTLYLAKLAFRGEACLDGHALLICRMHLVWMG